MATNTARSIILGRLSGTHDLIAEMMRSSFKHYTLNTTTSIMVLNSLRHRSNSACSSDGGGGRLSGSCFCILLFLASVARQASSSHRDNQIFFDVELHGEASARIDGLTAIGAVGLFHCPASCCVKPGF